jgi:predicted transcriptional regulator
MVDAGESLSMDDVLDSMANEQRRTLLVALLEHNPQDDTPLVDAESDAAAVERLVTMQHVHLPKLADYGIIEWDRETHEVTKGPKFDEIRPLLELLAEHEDELPADWL